MPRLKITHLNQCNGEIIDGFIKYDAICKKDDDIVDFYFKGFRIARLRGDFSSNEIELKDTTDEKIESMIVL